MRLYESPDAEHVAGSYAVALFHFGGAPRILPEECDIDMPFTLGDTGHELMRMLTFRASFIGSHRLR
jgi:hypothetical protein